MPAAAETRAGLPAAAPADEAPAPPLGHTQQRGSIIEMSGSMRDWATSTRPHFRNSLIMVRGSGPLIGRSIDRMWQRSNVDLIAHLQRAILEYRKGRTTRRDLEAAVERQRAELFLDHADDGNLLHDLTRRGFTRSLIQIILPAHPDVRPSLCPVRPSIRPWGG